MGFLRGLGLSLRSKRNAADSLLGGLESVSPSAISGWVHHPQHVLVEVRLLIGPHLIAQAPIGEPRPDVAKHLGLDGSVGFRLTIPEAPFPLPDSETPRIIALTADGSARFDLSMITQDQQTTTLLQLALRQELRGLQGHLDGLTPDGMTLHGWCMRRGSTTPVRVWLHSEGAEPLELLCDRFRPGMSDQGLPDRSGFLLALEDWPELAGRSVWVSFDPEGQLPLPTNCVLPLCLPEQRQSTSPEPMLKMAASTRPGMESQTTEMISPSVDLQDHWDQLEEFRTLLDRIEMSIESATKADQLANQLPPSRRRSARFRLWR